MIVSRRLFIPLKIHVSNYSYSQNKEGLLGPIIYTKNQTCLLKLVKTQTCLLTHVQTQTCSLTLVQTQNEHAYTIKINETNIFFAAVALLLDRLLY